MTVKNKTQSNISITAKHTCIPWQLSKCPDGDNASHSLWEVSIDWRQCHTWNTLQLTRRVTVILLLTVHNCRQWVIQGCKVL